MCRNDIEKKIYLNVEKPLPIEATCMADYIPILCHHEELTCQHGLVQEWNPSKENNAPDN